MGKQKDGRYKSKVVVGKRADGTNIVKWISGKTKRELEANRQRVLQEYRDGISAEDLRMLAVDWLYKWYDTYSAPSQKSAGAAQKRRRIDTFIAPCLKDKRLRAVSALDLQAIVNACDKGHTVMVQIVSILRGAFRAAYAQGIIPRDITAALISRPRAYTARRALTEEESTIVEKSFSEGFTERLMLSLFYYTGMRRGEVLGLRWGDVDFKRGVLHVRRSLTFRTGQCEAPKTDAGVRDIPVCPELMAILREYRGINTAFVVQAKKGGPLSESSFKWRWAKVQALLSDEITPHYFRHNYATRLYDAGVDVLTAAKVLGHADPTTTLRIYTDIENSRRVQAGGEAVKGAFAKKVGEKLAGGED